MNVTGAELKKIAYEKRITSWTAFECPTCDYPIKFKFNGEYPEVQHDPGCLCTEDVFRQRYESSSWEALADYINSILDIEILKKTKKFWNL